MDAPADDPKRVSKTVFVCQVFHPDEQATSQLFSDLLAQLAARGHRYEVLAGFPLAKEAQATGPSREMWRGICIRRGGLRLDYKRSLASRGLGYGSYCLWLVWRLVFCTPAGARLLVVTNPPFAPVLVHWCSLVRGWTYEVMLLDVYPDGLIALGKLQESAPITKLWRWLNRHALRSAQTVLVLGRDMLKLCETRYAVPRRRLLYTPHWSPMESTGRVAAEDTRLWRKLGYQDEFVIQYSGNMGLWHDMECIVRAAHLLREEPKIRFLMIGGGIRRAAAEQLSNELGLKNMVWLSHQPKEQLNDSLACCHAALLSQRAGLAGVAVPCKIYGILASGRAVLAQVPDESEVSLVLTEENCGVVTVPGDAVGLAAAIRQLANDRKATAERGNRAFQAYQSKYTVQAAADTFERILHGDVASRQTTI